MSSPQTNTHTGLTSAEVEASRLKYGSNQLTPPGRDPWWVQLLEKFTDPLIVILMVAAVISFIPVIFVPGHSWIESAGIVCAVLLATIVGFVNEYKANKEFDILNQVNDVTPVRVLRDGKHSMVPKNELVVGDIVTLETGEEVPADGVVVESVALRINQSSLTGESEPVLKTPVAEEESLPGAYPRNVVLRSTLVAEGHGVICITRVGDATEIGKVAEAASEDSEIKSPLNQQLDGLSKGINVLGSSIAFILFISLIVQDTIKGNFDLSQVQWGFFGCVMAAMGIALLKVWYPIFRDLLGYCKIEVPAPAIVEAEGGMPWLKCLIGGVLVFAAGTGLLIWLGQLGTSPAGWLPATAAEHLLLYFMIAITLIVVAVPEGLPMSVTLSLAYSMRKMAQQNNLVRRMDACETIGAATVVCSDKTGTLTMNLMTVREAHFPGLGEEPAAAAIFPLLTEAVAANSTADLDSTGKVLGNVTEGAMLMYLRDNKADYAAAREKFSLIGQLPFHTRNKYMATCGKSAVLGGTPVIYVKGAPEVVLSMCSKTSEGELSEATRNSELDFIRTAQRKAMRVLGLAYREGSADTPEAVQAACCGLSWLGCFVIQDPVRPDVPDAVATCRRAGVGIKIVTGDNFETACQIGREIGLLPEGELPPNSVLTGDEFGKLTDEQLYDSVEDLRVLSRAKPMDKLRLVNTLQKRNHVVAVTGDGTNDAPALNHADVGLSMGITGTSVAKEASDIILLDDSFASITRAIKWGRSLYRNIQKFIVFQLTVNVAACGIAALGPFIGCELPLTVTQMLWVNLIMDTFAALALASEPPSDDVMEQKPRNKMAFIITPTMWKWILGLGFTFVAALVAYVKTMPTESADPEAFRHSVTVLFTGFVMLQFWNLFNARVYGSNKSFVNGIFTNKSFLLIAAIILIGQVLAVEYGGNVFRTVSLSVQEWLLIAAATFPVLLVGEVVRFIARVRAET
ncbi:MAG: calcium-translocating P-type ATPase, PMCA-type [Akkermansia sp.]|nr:calcium-translocating P-type ATPase, PMCA-type [Akkermansia sp.]